MLCPSCGDDANPPDAKFCEGCGASLDGSAPHPRRGCQCEKPDLDADGFCQICGLKPAKIFAAAEWEQAFDASLAIASDKGRRHPTNQDFGLVARRADGAALIVVADGVSASDNPEASSRAAAKAVEKAFLKNGASDDSLSAEAAALALEAADAVIATPIAERVNDGAASTIVIALARENAVSGALDVGVAWVGDSRAYLIAANVPETLAHARQFMGDAENRVRRVFARGGDAFALRARHHPMARHAALRYGCTHQGRRSYARRQLACLQRRSLELCRRALGAGAGLHRRRQGRRRCGDHLSRAGGLRQRGGGVGQHNGRGAEGMSGAAFPRRLGLFHL